jgi:hypothetical protein
MWYINVIFITIVSFYIQHPTVNKFASFIFIFRISRCRFPYLWRHSSMTSFFNDVILQWRYYEFSLLHIFSLVIQPWMSAYIRKTDVYIFSPQKRLKHGRQNFTLHWINGIIRNNKCIFTKLNAVFILKTACSKFYKLYKYNIDISHNKTTGLRNSFNNLNVNNM